LPPLPGQTVIAKANQKKKRKQKERQKTEERKNRKRRRLKLGTCRDQNGLGSPKPK
jgi:hypothetical protein